jgi:hypothetical protein
MLGISRPDDKLIDSEEGHYSVELVVYLTI